MLTFIIFYLLPATVCLAYTAAGMRYSLYDMHALMRVDEKYGSWFYQQGLCIFTGGISFFPIINIWTALGLALMVPFVWRPASEFHDAFKKDKK